MIRFVTHHIVTPILCAIAESEKRILGALADAIAAVEADDTAILAVITPIGTAIAAIQTELASSGDVPGALVSLAQLHTDLSGAAATLGADATTLGTLANPPPPAAPSAKPA